MAIDWGNVLGGMFGGASTGAVAGPWGAVGGGILGAISGGVGGGAGKKGGLIGGTVIDTGGGRIRIKTASGTIVSVKRAKHRRYHGRRGGNSMNSMLKTAMQYKMLASAMK